MNWIHLVISCSIPGGFVWSQAGELPTRWKVKDGKYPVPCKSSIQFLMMALNYKALAWDGPGWCDGVTVKIHQAVFLLVYVQSRCCIYFIYFHVLTPLIVVWFKANIIFKEKNDSAICLATKNKYSTAHLKVSPDLCRMHKTFSQHLETSRRWKPGHPLFRSI